MQPHTIMVNLVEELSRISRRQQETLMDRMRKEIKLILLYGKLRRRNILCAGKARGAKVSPDGILNARQWQQSIWELNLIFMAAAWTFCFLTMKVRLHKALFVIIIRLQNTGCIII